MNQTKTGRIKELDVAKGIAITLVVVGHVCARSHPLGNEWYSILKDVIYTFHMPLFIFLAGITSFRLFERIKNTSDYFSFIRTKFVYFGSDFIFLSMLIFSGKIIMQQYVHVDNPVVNLRDFFVIFYDPTHSFSSFLWFIYTLVIFYAITPLLLKLFNKNIAPIFILALVMHFIKVTSLFTMSSVFLYFIFYFSGYVFWIYQTVLMYHIKKYGFLYLILFIISIFIYKLHTINTTQYLALPATLYIAYILKECKIFAALGSKTQSIYLYNTIFIGLTKAALFLILPWDGPVFLFYFFALSFTGLAGPIYLHQAVTRMKEVIKRPT